MATTSKTTMTAKKTTTRKTTAVKKTTTTAAKKTSTAAAKKTTKKTVATTTKKATAAKKTTTAVAKKTAVTKPVTTTKRTTTRSKAVATKHIDQPIVTESAKVREISFVNHKVCKTRYTARLGRKPGTIHLSMSLKDNDDKLVETDFDVEQLIGILLVNYNIGVVGLCDGVYTYEFDKKQLCQFLLDNQLIGQGIYDLCCVDRFV